MGAFLGCASAQDDDDGDKKRAAAAAAGSPAKPAQHAKVSFDKGSLEHPDASPPGGHFVEHDGVPVNPALLAAGLTATSSTRSSPSPGGEPLAAVSRPTAKTPSFKWSSSGRQHSLGRLQQGLPMDAAADAELTTEACGLRHIGFGPLKKENQDEFFEQVGGFGGRKDGCCYCIFDGHGNHGGRVAAFCRRQLPIVLERELRDYNEAHVVAGPSDISSVEGILSNSFVEAERLLHQSNVNCSSSGTTASVVFQQGNRLWAAAAGDSRVVILQQLPGEEGRWQPLPLTIDHRPIRGSERARVEAAGGRVEPKKLPSGKSVGEPRLWLQDIPTPGLLLSRSIGDDLATSIGCTAKPELVYMTLRPSVDNYLVMASDGIWDVLDNERVCSIITEAGDPKRACDRILKAALAEWEEKLAADNISIIVVRFTWGKTIMEDGHMPDGPPSGDGVRFVPYDAPPAAASDDGAAMVDEEAICPTLADEPTPDADADKADADADKTAKLRAQLRG